MTKTVYRFDGKDDFSVDLVADDYALEANETFDDPGNVLLPVSFTGGKIVGATAEAHEAYQARTAVVPEGANTPDPTMMAINALGIQVAQLTAKLAEQEGGTK